MTYAPSTHWDEVVQRLQQSGSDLDWGNQWTGAFVETLRAASIDTLLDLGCGTGNDVVGLANAGFQMTGLDYSAAAIHHASKKAPARTAFVVADMALPLPLAASSFDAVMSNVALHIFADTETRAVFNEIWRIVRPNRLFVFHLNALEDRPLRLATKGVLRAIEPNYVLEPDGQTMHFFSEDY